MMCGGQFIEGRGIMIAGIVAYDDLCQRAIPDKPGQGVQVLSLSLPWVEQGCIFCAHINAGGNDQGTFIQYHICRLMDEEGAERGIRPAGGPAPEYILSDSVYLRTGKWTAYNFRREDRKNPGNGYGLLGVLTSNCWCCRTIPS